MYRRAIEVASGSTSQVITRPSRGSAEAIEIEE
jgi:hypothetical protein